MARSQGNEELAKTIEGQIVLCKRLIQASNSVWTSDFESRELNPSRQQLGRLAFDSTCWTFLQPGMTQDTAGFCKHQAKAH